MSITLNRCSAQSTAINNARVVQFIADDHVVAAYKGGNDPKICCKARLEDECCFYPFPGGDFVFQGFVRFESAGNCSNGTRTATPLVRPGLGCLAKFLIIRES